MGGWFTKSHWRDPGREKWTLEKEEQLVKEIIKIDKEASEKDEKNIKAHVVLCGPSNAGKSSFMNSAIGVLKGRQTHISSAAGNIAQGTTLTRTYIRVAAPDAFNNFRLSDMPGILESDDKGILIEDIIALVKGHIKPGYTFQEQTPIDKENEYYVKEPSADEMVHCLVFVFDAKTLYAMNCGYETKIRTIIKKLHLAEIPFVIVLTKMDLIDEELDGDIKKMHESTKVKEAVRGVRETFGVQERSIFPVVNLVKDIDIKPLTKIPHLLALRTILAYARDFLDVNIDKNNHDLKTKTIYTR